MIVANWKMNGSIPFADDYARQLNNACPHTTATIVILPPSLYISSWAAGQSSQSAVVLGAQNIYPADKGAFTGEISGPMLKEFGCRYVLVGHSERRRLFHEHEKFIREKFHHVKEHGMIPILCVGETLEQRKNGETESILKAQVASVYTKDDAFRSCVIAYEPVWAIGTGQAASAEQVQEVHAMLRACVMGYDELAAENLSLLYGGSVTVDNASVLFGLPDVDGGLIGGASLDVQQFVEIVKCIN